MRRSLSGEMRKCHAVLICFSKIQSQSTSLRQDCLSILAFPKSPDTKTTKTAVYAAVAAKMASRVAPVDSPRPIAKRMMKATTSASRASGSVTKYSTIMGPIKREAAMNMPQMFASSAREEALKYWTRAWFPPPERFENSQWSFRNCERASFAATGARATRSSSKVSSNIDSAPPLSFASLPSGPSRDVRQAFTAAFVGLSSRLIWLCKSNALSYIKSVSGVCHDMDYDSTYDISPISPGCLLQARAAPALPVDALHCASKPPRNAATILSRHLCFFELLRRMSSACAQAGSARFRGRANSAQSGLRTFGRRMFHHLDRWR